METGQLARSLRLSVAEGALATSMGSLISGLFLTGFCLALGGSRLQVGILAALPALANIAQLGGAWFIERGGHRKQFCIWTSYIARLLWLPVVLVPWFFRGRPGEEQVWYIVALVAVASVFSALGCVAWLAWIKGLVPESVRVTFFGRRTLMNTGLSFSICLLGGLLVDAWNAYAPGSLGGFLIVFVGGMVCGLVGMPILSAIPDPAPVRPGAGESFAAMVATPLREPNFRRLVLFYAYWNLAVNLAQPFFAVFMLQKLQLPFWYIIALGTLSSVSGMAMNNLWTRLGQKFGMKPIVLLATLGDAFYPLWWLLLGPQTAWLLIPLHLGGMFNSPLTMGPDNIALKLVPDRNAARYLAVFKAVVGPVTALAAVLGGLLAGALADVEWSVGPLSLGGLKIIFLLSFVGRLSSLLLLGGVVEPRSQPIERVVRVLRRTERYRRRTIAAGELVRPVERQPLPLAKAG